MGNAKISAQDGIGYGVPVARVVTAPTVRLDYSTAKNKPTINGKEIEGELTLEDLGITPEQLGAMTEAEVQKLVGDALKGLGIANDQDIENLFGPTEEQTPTPQPVEDNSGEGDDTGDNSGEQGEDSGNDDNGPGLATDDDIYNLFD